MASDPTGALKPTSSVPNPVASKGRGGNSDKYLPEGMRYRLTTDTVMDYYVRGCHSDEDVAIWDFCEWLQGIKDSSYREGRKDGEVFGDLR